jgi:YggT family protein
VITIVYEVAQSVLSLFKWAVILAAVIQTLISFGVLDSRNRLVWSIGDFLHRVTEPALRPIRRTLPYFGGLDISYLVLLLLIWVAQMLLARIYGAVAYGNLQGLLM